MLLRLLLWLLLLAPVHAAEIAGPEVVAPGQLVVLEVEDLGEKSASWIAIDPLDLSYQAFEGGKYFAFSSGCQSGSRVIVLTTVVDWESKTLEQLRRIVTVEGDAPDPGPGPGPGPDPTPPGPRAVTVIYESEQSTPEFALATQELQKYAKAKGHSYRMVDDDAVTPDGGRPIWLLDYLARAGSAGLSTPFLVVLAGGTAPLDDRITVVAFPSERGKAIELLKTLE